jgi:hypothetical protein
MSVMGGAAATLLLWMAAEASDLTLPFGESSRPRLCLPSASPDGKAAVPESVSGASPWDRVRQQQVVDLCVGLARAQVRLARVPAEVAASARRLAEAFPARPEPRVLEARALLRSGNAAASWDAWQAARARGFDAPRESGAEPASAHALRDFAVAAVATGHGEVASGAYRRLVSLLDAWPDRRDVQRIYLEAAMAALRRGPEQLDEAAGYLSAAESGATSTGLRAYAAGLRAFVQMRRGLNSPDSSRLDAPEVWHFVSLVREGSPSYWPAVPPHEPFALASLLVERYSNAEAAELWDRYVAGLEGSPVDPALLGLARERKARLARTGGAR